MQNLIEKKYILGVKIEIIDLERLAKHVLFVAKSREKYLVAYVNVRSINIVFRLGWFKDFINKSQIAFCDGYGIKWVGYFLQGNILQLLSPPDWFGCLADRCAKQDILQKE